MHDLAFGMLFQISLNHPYILVLFSPLMENVVSSGGILVLDDYQ